MALKSMTGFGRGEAAAHGWKVEVELSSVNRKQFDVRVNLPRMLTAMESLVYGCIHENVSRGCVTGTVKVQMAGGSREGAVKVDIDAARSGVKQLRAAAKALGLDDDLTASVLLAIPDVVQRHSQPDDVEQAWPMVKRALRVALKDLASMRAEEGRALEKDITRRLGKLKKIAARVARRAPRVQQRYRAALLQRLADAEIEIIADDPALLRELAFFADKSDISEELTRLESHFAQAATLMAASKPVGRALDFLCQELFREINTIGSKANDPEIGTQVIQFKAGLESVREQVQNVE